MGSYYKDSFSCEINFIFLIVLFEEGINTKGKTKNNTLVEWEEQRREISEERQT